jgi:hypothetical protein
VVGEFLRNRLLGVFGYRSASFAMRGAITRKHVWEAVRVISVMAAVALAIPATRGEIGHWGIWLGLGMVMASVGTALLV